jgi:hypothetical protein
MDLAVAWRGFFLVMVGVGLVAAVVAFLVAGLWRARRR